MTSAIQQFFTSPAYAVVGASSNRTKYGNKVLRCYMQHHYTVYPVNPNEPVIEGLNTMASITDLPDNVYSISVITPPPITEKIIKQAIAKNIQHIWIQPGAESATAIQDCKMHGIEVIAGGPCILVQLGFKETSA
ncbi:MAG: yccU [Gammaproteobacteria bacterium]|jgi:predicted CoA-binding protein|nr:yccU [Gammaproteobacteria bacterium]